ncbi:MAG: hypothetical protein H6721_16390 [Sandaracinus sp.]|nr:hypothetical protein [Sandaracinus sp.]MCB9623214.1 hypothetical protein [Sandaracinus sp.]MCB9633698.1 hypothetical protein [Sandaracinus sp.]
MTSSTHCFLVLSLLTLVACGDDSTGTDGGDRSDAGAIDAAVSDASLDASSFDGGSRDANVADADLARDAGPDAGLPAETCDGTDEDDDGRVDEGFGIECACSSLDAEGCESNAGCVALGRHDVSGWWSSVDLCASSPRVVARTAVLLGGTPTTDCLGMPNTVLLFGTYDDVHRLDEVRATVDAMGGVVLDFDLARGISPGGSARLSSSLADDRCPGGSSGWDEPGAWSTVATLRRELNLSDGTLSLAAGAIDALPEPAFGHLGVAMRSHLDQQTVAFTDALGEALYTAPTVDRVFEAEHVACVPAGPCVRGEGPVWGRPVGDEGCSLLEYACLPPGWEVCEPSFVQRCL